MNRAGDARPGPENPTRRASSLDLPRLHVICSDPELDRVDAVGRIGELLEAGKSAVAVHLRPGRTSALRCLEIARAIQPIAESAGGWLVVNGRTDVAKIVGPRAVQLGRGALSVAATRALLGEACAVGVSVHTLEECRRSASAGADYLLLGTIYPTPSHPGRGGAGVSLISGCAGEGLPVIAIGGIDEPRIREVLDAGAHGVAVIRAVWNADDPAEAVRRLSTLLSKVGATGDEARETGTVRT